MQEKQVWAVGALCQQINWALNQQFSQVAVKGEISGWTIASSGHCYFSLKDQQGQLRCTMFARAADKLQFEPRNGSQVKLIGRLVVYEPRGDLQITVEQMQPLGQGDLYTQFMQLKEKLQQQGLFEQQRKKSIIPNPRAIAVVTSLTGAALKDVLTVLQRRVPHIPVYLFNTLVQGVQAAEQIQQALDKIKQFNRSQHANIEVVLLVRGGGSMEDLFCFNDEQLAYKLADFPIPVISGVGHETDFTIADFVADLRAATPTAAAELCAIAVTELLIELKHWQTKLNQSLYQQLDTKAQQLDRLSFQLTKPAKLLQQKTIRLWQLQQQLQHVGMQILQQKQQKVDYLREKLIDNFGNYVIQQQHKLQRLQDRLNALNPELVLKRGYTMVFDKQNNLLSSVAKLAPQQSITVQFYDGKVSTKISTVKSKS